MCPQFLFAQEVNPIVDAWETFDTTFYKSNLLPPRSIFLDLADDLITFYQNDISIESISRCPFVISCSSFCKEAINKYGLLGLAMFIDRYFYRENIDAFSHYNLIQTNYGVLKLDDKIYLFEN